MAAAGKREDPGDEVGADRAPSSATAQAGFVNESHSPCQDFIPSYKVSIFIIAYLVAHQFSDFF